MATKCDFSCLGKDVNNFVVHKGNLSRELASVLKIHPFAHYAAYHCGWHARDSSDSGLLYMMMEFFQQEANVFVLVVLLIPQTFYRTYQWESGKRSVEYDVFRFICIALQYENPCLLLASCYNLWRIVSILLDLGVSSKMLNESGVTVLHVASRNGLPTNVKLLVERGADIEAKGDEKGFRANECRFFTYVLVDVKK